MGLAFNSTGNSVGIMGIGYDTNEAAYSVYPNIIDEMVSQGLITKKAYSLYLDDLQASTGSIIFGGIDTDKFSGNLAVLPVVPDDEDGTKEFIDLQVELTSYSITNQSGAIKNFTGSFTSGPALLDSGTTLTNLPDDLANEIFTSVGAVDDTNNSGNVFINCDYLTAAPDMTFNYGFGNNTIIKVPVSELISDLPEDTMTPDLPFSNACAFGLAGTGGGPTILGDTFLRSAYVVYNLADNEIGLAQTNFNSMSSNIVEFDANSTGIPNLTGVASSASTNTSDTSTSNAVASASPSGMSILVAFGILSTFTIHSTLLAF